MVCFEVVSAGAEDFLWENWHLAPCLQPVFEKWYVQAAFAGADVSHR